MGYERHVSEGSAVMVERGCRHAPLSLGVDGIASGKHGDELLDSPLAGLRALGRGYAAKTAWRFVASSRSNIAWAQERQAGLQPDREGR